MADPRIAIKKLLVFEGWYANVKDDLGGETYRGITRINYPNWIGWAIIDKAKLKSNFPNNLKLIPELDELVFDFYIANYWIKINGDKIKVQQTADSMLDEAVLEGLSAAIKREERIAHLPETGKISDSLTEKLNHLA